MDKLDTEGIDAILMKVSESGNRMISELSKYLNVGPIYLEDMIVSAGLNPKGRLEVPMAVALKASILDFLEKIKSPNPIIYMKDGVAVDYSVFPLKKYAALEMDECGSISEMLDRANIAERSATKNDSVINDTSEVDAVIAQQRELVKRFNEDSAMYAQCGKRIFERMGEINALIMRMAEKKKPTLEELRREFPELNVEELSLKDRTVTMEV
jgi:predicted ribosome quality control (RQC) complex YloA/Tae2 family protein